MRRGREGVFRYVMILLPRRSSEKEGEDVEVV